MKTLPVTAVEYQALTKRNPRSRVVVTALLSVLLIATIISFGGQYTPSGVLKLTGHGSPAPIEAAITIIAEYEDATAAADQQQQQYSTTSTTTVTSNAAAEEEEVLTQYTPLQDFETLSDYDDDGVYYSTLAEAQAAAASTPAAAADSAAEVPVTVVAGAAKLSSSSSSSSRSFNPVAADYQAVDSLGGVMQQYNALARYNAEALADADEAAAVDSSSSSSSQWAASLPAATATASAVDDSHKAQITAADVGLSEQSEQTQTYQPLADIEQQPLWSDPDYEEQMYLQQETAESLEQPIPADELMLSQAAEQLGLAQEAALQQATLDESALQYGALQAALQQEQPAWLQAYNEAVRQREAEQQYTTAAAAGAGAAAAVFEPDWQQQQQNAYEYETDAEEDADAFWDESEDAEVVQEAFSLPQEEQLQLQPQQQQQQQQQDATTTSGSSSTGSSSSNSQIRDGWQYHHIFKGQPGTLDKCPAAWLIPDLWVEPRVGSSSNSAGQMLPFTAEVQRKIWEHQHPADCSKAKFLLYIPNNPTGIGSVIHHMSTALQAALDSGRVLAEIPGANFLTWDQHCPKDQRTLGSCYFVPLTNCSVTNDMLLQAELLDTRMRRSLQRLLNRDPSLPQYVKAAYDLTYKYPNKKRVPVMFHQLMEASMIPTERRYYWWRAQSTAYTVRPNERTLAELQRRKSLLFRGNPLQPSCISAFVRHGDKGTEATVFTDSAYEQAVLKLREVDSSLSRQIFLSTEDPATVQYFTDASRGWDTSYVDMPRKPDTSISNAEYMQRHGYAEEMLNGLLNLDLALDCDGFVSSIASNWARLIDELRSTVRCKAGAVHVDADPRFSPLFMSYGTRRL